MNINIGDEVRFLNDVGGGKVTSIINKEMVNVETNDGFEVPTYIKNIVIVNDIDNSRNGKTTISKSAATKNNEAEIKEKPKSTGFVEKNQIKGSLNPEFNLAFVPENLQNIVASPIKIFLINDSNFTLIYQFAEKIGGNYETIDAGILEANTKIELSKINESKISNLPTFCFQLLYFKQNGTTIEDPIQKEVVITPVKLAKQNSYIKTSYFKTAALIIKLAEHPLKAELEKLTESDYQQITKIKEPIKLTTPTLPSLDFVEIDLHIAQLVDNLTGLENSDMLKIQIDTFRKEMANAIRKSIKKIVFIHGVGDGVLKNEIRRTLQREYSKYDFQDASFREYGFGATLVILKKG